MNNDNLLASEVATLERRAQIRQLHDEGLTPRQIAVELDLSVQAIYKQLSNLGLKPNPRKVAS